MTRFLLALLLVAFKLITLALSYNEGNRNFTFLSRPDLRPQTIQFSILERVWLDIDNPYIFLAPYVKDPASQLLVQSAPCIYDLNGNLIWSGYGSAATSYVFNFRPQMFNNSLHLTFATGAFLRAGNDLGRDLILDSQYSTVATISSGNGRISPDAQVYNIYPKQHNSVGDVALVSLYQPRQWDLPSHVMGRNSGWVMDMILQEIDIVNGKVLYEWRALDHIPLNESYYTVGMNSFVSDGTSVLNAFDYLHLNSAIRAPGNAYLISCRHANALYLISRNDGAIIWKLGGKRSNFQLVNFNFSSQHDAQVLHYNRTHWTISLFNNAYDTFVSTSDQSRGLIISLDLRLRIATRLREYSAPRPILSPNQGNLQTLLPSGNRFIGWGDQPFFSEFLPNGTCIMHAQFGPLDTNLPTRTVSYIAYRSDWHGYPDNSPALFIQAFPENRTTRFYASWNGATEIKDWNFFAASTKNSASWTNVGSTTKAGFETVFEIQGMWKWGYVVARDVNLLPMANGNSLITQTYIPERG